VVVKDFDKLAPVPPIIISMAIARTEKTTIAGFAAPMKPSLVAKTARVRHTLGGLLGTLHKCPTLCKGRYISVTL
jgi:hypothetical protein